MSIALNKLSKQLELIKKSKVHLRNLATSQKNQILLALSEKIKNSIPEIIAKNAIDIKEYKLKIDYRTSYLDRLTLDEKRILSMCESLKEVAALNDPIGEITSQKTLPNQLILKQKKIPLGVIFLIFESRPNVITEAFSLALKSGNAIILKGGKESNKTSAILYRLITETLIEAQLSPDCFWGMCDTQRSDTDFLLKQNKYIDVLIPRGGDQLIEYVTEHSRIPIIKNDRGLCHLYVHQAADLSMAIDILINAKTQRPGVCNSIETLLVDEIIAKDFLPMAYQALVKKNVELFACKKTLEILKYKENIRPIDEHSYDTEYLDLKINIRVVKDLAEAISHIDTHGSSHSEAIVTKDEMVAKQFQENIDAAAVYWNASTRFTDGGQFGMGGEIGISTQKLHVRGPVGLQALTTLQWLVEGKGQVRPG